MTRTADPSLAAAPNGSAPRPPGGVSRARLRVEFAALYLLAPLATAVLLPVDALFPALFAVTAVGIVLLAMTPGFRWRSLLEGGLPFWPVAAIALASFLGGWWALLAWAPEAQFALARGNPRVMTLVLIFYPLASALPQELVFRPLFFRRYAEILPRGAAALVLNAAVFSLAHLMFWNALVAGMTFVGGLAFAWAYASRGSFPLAVVMHAVAGNLLFLLGLGVWFYSGNVVRPF